MEPLLAVPGAREALRQVGWRSGDLSDALADRVAVACGLHPSSVWGDAWRLAGLPVHVRVAIEAGEWGPMVA